MSQYNQQYHQQYTQQYSQQQPQSLYAPPSNNNTSVYTLNVEQPTLAQPIVDNKENGLPGVNGAETSSRNYWSWAFDVDSTFGVGVAILIVISYIMAGVITLEMGSSSISDAMGLGSQTNPNFNGLNGESLFLPSIGDYCPAVNKKRGPSSVTSYLYFVIAFVYVLLIVTMRNRIGRRQYVGFRRYIVVYSPKLQVEKDNWHTDKFSFLWKLLATILLVAVGAYSSYQYYESISVLSKLPSPDFCPIYTSFTTSPSAVIDFAWVQTIWNLVFPISLLVLQLNCWRKNSIGRGESILVNLLIVGNLILFGILQVVGFFTFSSYFGLGINCFINPSTNPSMDISLFVCPK